jgi:hypothetical protein
MQGSSARCFAACHPSTKCFKRWSVFEVSHKSVVSEMQGRQMSYSAVESFVKTNVKESHRESAHSSAVSNAEGQASRQGPMKDAQ